MSARDEVLRRVRAARPSAPVDVPRDYRTVDGGADLVDLFVDRLIDYKATVRRCDPGGLAGAVGELLSDASAVVAPAGARAWLAAYPGRVLREPLTVTDLDAAGVAVLTGCAVAVARTGTLILDAGPDQGRRALSLVPDRHVCVVHSGQIVGGVPEALARLADPTRPLTLISGPSATSDIELNRVEGVHGPRRLDVVVVD
ncbi:LUD domain-containing protein [Phytohabitans sp. ZYX-F-186]|uniref:LUD domain-containing protein n=1 Tax=Phytohabitans maris TaxID=3071409 RepID=A0ABU0ZLC9_9ACTN|nr:LUD domain-containing protein [Phytohabitans sp. ZYX-F-186]MDQ7907859.1 LUD domain-containing protein [Phytohabitans sp. ZYX-F-186]